MRSASEYCKSLGLKSVAEVARAAEVDRVTLHRWFKSKPKLFTLLVDGCVWRRELEKRK